MTTTIKTQSSLTKDILIDWKDGNTSLNSYGEFACFIGTGQLIDNKDKTLKVLRFESEQFVLDSIKNIHEMWLDFDKKISDYCAKNLDKFVESHLKVSIIKIS